MKLVSAWPRSVAFVDSVRMGENVVLAAPLLKATFTVGRKQDLFPLLCRGADDTAAVCRPGFLL